MFKRLAVLSILSSALLIAESSVACTDIHVIAADGTQVIARSMEFALQLNSDLVTIHRGTSFAPTAPDGKPAMSWKAKYGYVLVDGLKQVIAIDGMNEQGLAFEYLYLPGETTYQTVPAGKNNQALPYFNLGDWILGNFKTVDEVRQALANVYVYEQTMPTTGKMVFPLHAAIHDATGKGIVVEFIDGKMEINNYVGVMTNSPNYTWQVKNLPQYFNLSPYNPKPIIVDGVSYSEAGQGAGMLGLPGDISPPSRFIKMAYMLQNVYQPLDALEAVNLAEHIMNNVDIPAGIVREKTTGPDSYETTEWTVFKDLTHKVFYYHTYQNLSLRSVDLKQIDFSENAPQLVMPLASAPVVIDVTSQLKSMAVTPPPVATPPTALAPVSPAVNAAVSTQPVAPASAPAAPATGGPR
jgi:choloylglycine hydrolase